MEDNDDNKNEKEERRWEVVSLSAKKMEEFVFLKHSQMYFSRSF